MASDSYEEIGFHPCFMYYAGLQIIAKGWFGIKKASIRTPFGKRC